MNGADTTAGARVAPAVAMRGITKRFPGVLANDAVELEAAVGEVHALLGENGAGKSTLSHILTGLYRPDEGEIFLYGERVDFASPREAIDARVLILDEPTAVLTPQEVEALFPTLRQMAAEGRTVIFISHKLHEVMAVADRVTVLRGGRSIATLSTS